MSQQSTPSSFRVRANAKTPPTSSAKAGGKAAPPSPKENGTARRSLHAAYMMKPREPPKKSMFSKSKQRDDNNAENHLKAKLEASENLVKILEVQVMDLKREVEMANEMNKQLDACNRRLLQELASSRTKAPAISAGNEASRPTPTAKASLPPPPPPPRPARNSGCSSSVPNSAQKAPSIAELYSSLRKQDGSEMKVGTSVHTSIVDEIQNRSAYLMAVKADVETRGTFIKELIQKVQASAHNDIEDLLSFVDWLDGELASLVDERAVLKHFNWPERKADAIREAAVEYRELKALNTEISSYNDDENVPFGMVLRKMDALLDKSEHRLRRLIKLRSTAMRSYQDLKIPTNWMLEGGMSDQLKEGAMKLATIFMKRVAREMDKESNQENWALEGVKFAYKAHQIAGGFNEETLLAFDEMKQRVPTSLIGSRQLLVAT